jgi:hypothetical protein
MASAQKKVIVRMTGGEIAWGYLSSASFSSSGQIELIEVGARAKVLQINQIQAIYYVKDFNLDDPTDPERLGRRAFPIRPKSEGLWVRLEFQSLAPLEGIIVVDLAFLDTLLDCQGLFLTPPDGRGNTVRLFIPRHSIRSLEVLGLITSPTRKLGEKTAKQAALALQAGLFEE